MNYNEVKYNFKFDKEDCKRLSGLGQGDFLVVDAYLKKMFGNFLYTYADRGSQYEFLLCFKEEEKSLLDIITPEYIKNYGELVKQTILLISEKLIKEETESMEKLAVDREAAFINYVKANKDITYKEIEENPPEGWSGKGARVFVQQLVDKGKLCLNDNLKLVATGN